MKDFKQTAVTQFISSKHNDNKQACNHKEEFVIEKKVVVEPKTKHLSLLVKPSTYAKLKAQSKNKGLSINEIANQIFEHYINKQI